VPMTDHPAGRLPNQFPAPGVRCGFSSGSMSKWRPIRAWLTGGHADGDRSTYGFGAVTCSPGSLSVLPSVTPSTAGICSTRDSPEEGWPDKR